MLSDLVTGSGNRPPKLLNMNDFGDWKDRIQTHIEGMEGGIWEAVLKRYERPIDESTRLQVSYRRRLIMPKRKPTPRLHKLYHQKFCINSHRTKILMICV